MNKFRYGLMNRPAGLGAVPKGNFELEASLEGSGGSLTRHGVIVYDRELTEFELISYELVQIATHSLISQMASEVALEMQDYAPAYVAMANDSREDFRSCVINEAGCLKKYRVFYGCEDAFANLVLDRLSAVSAKQNQLEISASA